MMIAKIVIIVTRIICEIISVVCFFVVNTVFDPPTSSQRGLGVVLHGGYLLGRWEACCLQRSFIIRSSL